MFPMRLCAWGWRSALILSLGYSSAHADEFTDVLRNHRASAVEQLIRNISPEGAKRGVVIASPTRHEPDYFRHWVRDAALVMERVIDLYQRSIDPDARSRYWSAIVDYVRFSRENQLSASLGEPLFLPDGRILEEEWGRPQNDGPALRAIALSHVARVALSERRQSWVRSTIFDGATPSQSVMKTDLDYLLNANESGFDLWEEVDGLHFYTRMVQRRALVEGAGMARSLGFHDLADSYASSARARKQGILTHWDKSKGYFVATLHRRGGMDHKASGLDSAVILAFIHGDASDGFLPLFDERVLATVWHLETAFKKLYPINWNGIPGIAIGRYPEDPWDGYSRGGEGNPWVLTTNAFAEFYYRLVRRLKRQGYVDITVLNFPFFDSLASGSLRVRVRERISAPSFKFDRLLYLLKEKGDSFLKRTSYHSGNPPLFAEQMNRHTGYMQGPMSLTWSCASLLSAYSARPLEN